MDRVIFAAEIKFPKILVPRLPPNSSNVNIKCPGMSRKIKTTVIFMWPASWSTDISSFYYSNINLTWIDYVYCYVWYVIFGFCSSVTIPGVTNILELHTGGKTLFQFLLKIWWYMIIWKDKLKTELCRLAAYSY